MRHDSVIIKTNAYGLVLYLNADIPFEQLLMDTAKKFSDAARFFRNAQMALTFRGRKLTESEELEIVRVITDNARMQIICIVDEDKETAEYYKNEISKAAGGSPEQTAQIYEGTLKNGQVLESDRTLVILGDVNPGATVKSDGNVIILGCCMGNVTAGFGGNDKCFVAALTLLPSVLKIASFTARSAITKREDNGQYPISPKITYIRDGHQVMEPLRAEVFRRMAAQAALESTDSNS